MVALDHVKRSLKLLYLNSFWGDSEGVNIDLLILWGDRLTDYGHAAGMAKKL